ncbi:MAG: MFS transporter [Caldimonas sp.]
MAPSPLARALPAMTALQAVVALGVFSLSVLAPQRGWSVAHLAAVNSLLFGVGAVGALMAGRLLERLGDWRVAACCAAAIAAGMLCLLVDVAAGPWLAALLFGLAFGPETPASASILSRVTPAARRPWVFSVRQTGNQIGAMTGSLLLPVLIAMAWWLPYGFVAAVALAMTAWCLLASRHERGDAEATRPGHRTVPAADRASWRRVVHSRPLLALAFVALCYTAVQMCLNTFLMTFAVRSWGMEIATASAWVAWMQGAGLAGRLFWGWLAQHFAGAARLLGGIGLLVAASGGAVLTHEGPSGGPLLGLFVGLLGFSASGWNGVLVAEVARLAGPREAGAITGVVLMAGYAGLALAPAAFAGLSGLASMSVAFGGLFAAAGAAGGVLLLMRPAAAPTSEAGSSTVRGGSAE